MKKGEEDDRSPEEVRGGLYMEWNKASPKVKISGSRNLALLKTAEIGPARVVPFLGFQTTALDGRYVRASKQAPL